MTRLLLALALCAGVVTGCRREPEDDQRTETLNPDVQQARANWPAGLAALIDSGNAAWRANDFDRAATLYREATQLAPNVTTAWFGVYMAEQARGNVAAADSAMARARELSPGASLMHGTPRDSAAARDTGARHP